MKKLNEIGKNRNLSKSGLTLLLPLIFLLGCSLFIKKKIDTSNKTEFVPVDKFFNFKIKTDSIIDGNIVLIHLSEILNESIKKLDPEIQRHYKVQDGLGIGFMVQDLVNLHNKNFSYSNKKGLDFQKMDFLNEHMYLFSDLDYSYAIDHFAFFYDDEVTVFMGVNCENFGDNLSEVLLFITKKVKNNSKKDILIRRLQNYEKFKFHIREDNYSTPFCSQF